MRTKEDDYGSRYDVLEKHDENNVNDEENEITSDHLEDYVQDIKKNNDKKSGKIWIKAHWAYPNGPLDYFEIYLSKYNKHIKIKMCHIFQCIIGSALLSWIGFIIYSVITAPNPHTTL